MAKVSQKKALLELSQSLLDFIFSHKPLGLSTEYININIQCGRWDRIVEYLDKFDETKIPCLFVSEWVGGITVTTPAVYIKATGKVITGSDDITGLNNLVGQYIRLADVTIPICPKCNEYVWDGDKCRNKLCENNKGGE